MKHDGYTISAHKEETLNHAMEPDSVTTYSVAIGKKVVEAGLPSEEAAKAAIRRRRRIRERAGLDPVG
jgi:hypothetical protein